MKQREPYEALAKTDKQRYEDEKASYNVSTELPLVICAPVQKLTHMSSRLMRRKKRRSNRLTLDVDDTASPTLP